uniref:Putative PD-(D/E)XK nuclease superfamily protein n=1 Tax=viral metagenome TaxID=1070528 RepID=A0A6H1Z8H6_9ZZZZ
MSVETQPKMSVHCRMSLAMKQANGSWFTDEACPAGHAAGMEPKDLLTLCMSCPIKEQLIAQKQEQTPAVTPDAAPSPPEGSGQPQPEPQPEPQPQEPPAQPKIVVVDRHGKTIKSPPLPQATMPPPSTVEVECVPDTPTVPQTKPEPEPEPGKALPVSPPTPSTEEPQNSDVTGHDPDSDAGLEPEAPAEAAPVPEAGTPQEVKAVLDQPIVISDSFVIGAEPDKPSMDDVLQSLEGYMGGTSEGGLSSHVLSDLQQCDQRCYLAHIQGWRPRQEKAAFAEGSLFHAALAFKYAYGFEAGIKPIEAAIQAGYAEIGRNVRRLYEGMHEKYAREEAKTWCPRAVEHNIVFWLSVKSGRSTVKIPISLRVDLILALKEAGESCPGLGPAPQGVYLVDHKTSSSLTRDLTSGFGRSFQFRTYAMGYIFSGAEAEFGPMQGVMVNIAVKHKKIDPDCFQRIKSPYGRNNAEAFLHGEIEPLASELWRRLQDERYHNDPSLWPEKTTSCIGRYRCDYFDICDSGLWSDFVRCPERSLLNKEWAKLPKSSSSSSKKSDEAKPQDPKKLRKKQLQEMVVASVATGFLQNIDGGVAGWESLKKENFLKEGYTDKTVLADLATAMAAMYEPFTRKGAKKVTYQQAVEGCASAQMTFKKSGLSWLLEDGTAEGINPKTKQLAQLPVMVKGSLTWKHIAEWIVNNVWFNLQEVMPDDAQGLPG